MLSPVVIKARWFQGLPFGWSLKELEHLICGLSPSMKKVPSWFHCWSKPEKEYGASDHLLFQYPGKGRVTFIG